MKRLFLILLFLCSCIQAADLRPWLLSDGRSFLATYTKSTDESVTLTAKNGKTATFKIIQLSIPDLLYLQENHSLNTKDLKIPALLNAEKLLQINSANFKKPGSQSFKGEEDTHRFTVVVTPHFIIMHPNKMKPDHLIDTLERVWFSIAYRHPGLPEFWGIKRRVYLLFDNKDVYDDLRTYAYEANLEQEMPPRQANQIQQDWIGRTDVQIARNTSARFPLKNDFLKKFKSDSHAQLVFLNEDSKILKGPDHLFTQESYRKIHDELYPAPDGKNKDYAARHYRWALTYALDHQLTGALNLSEGDPELTKLLIKPLGKPKEWASSYLAETPQATAAAIFEKSSNYSSRNTQEKYDEHWKGISLSGLFLNHDLRHALGTAKLSSALKEKREIPNSTEFPTFYGYNSQEDMDKAFQDFIKNL